MQKLILSLLASVTFFLTGCLETTQEITLQEDGSGTYVNSNDLGKVLAVLKNIGGGTGDNIPSEPMDTSFTFGDMAASMENLSEEEKEILKKGSMHLTMNYDEETFISTMTFPFSTLDEIQKINHLSGKVMSESMKDKIPGEMQGTDNTMPAPSSFDDYYILEFSKDKLTRKLNKEKFAVVESDEFLNGLKEAAAMGLPVQNTFIINLPRPAEKAEGKNVKLSADKMKVTILSTMGDFYDNPENMEFKIKY